MCQIDRQIDLGRRQGQVPESACEDYGLRASILMRRSIFSVLARELELAYVVTCGFSDRLDCIIFIIWPIVDGTMGGIESPDDVSNLLLILFGVVGPELYSFTC